MWDTTRWPPFHCAGKGIWWTGLDGDAQRAHCACGAEMEFSRKEMEAIPGFLEREGA